MDNRKGGMMMTRYLVALGISLMISRMAIGDDLSAGWAAYKTGEYEQAYDLFSKAFRADPSSVEANFALGEAAVQIKKFSHAVFAYDRVLMAQPDHEKAQLGKAKALLALGQAEEAREAYSALLSETSDEAMRSSAKASIKEIDRSTRELVLKGKAYLSGVYDDNVNYGADDNLIPATSSIASGGVEGGLDILAEYDVGQKNSWMLVGGLGLFDSWYDEAPEQEVANVRGFAGLRSVGKRNIFEVVGRGEKMWYGGNSLVDICGADAAWLFAAAMRHHFITRATIENRNYDEAFDPLDGRDSVYSIIGETWKYYFRNRNNNLAVGADLFSEDAKNNSNSYVGYRIRLDGQVELPGGLITYAGGRYRLGKYDDPAFLSTTDREDDRWDLFVGVRRKFGDRFGVDLQYLYVRNDSNEAFYDYDRNRVSLSGTLEF
jgi:tetratricopeptide (TPR) repeat protein